MANIRFLFFFKVLSTKCFYFQIKMETEKEIEAVSGTKGI